MIHSIRKTQLSRRTLLAALGGAASAMPLLHARPGRAADAGRFPTRLLIVTWNNGVHPPTWHHADGPLAIDPKLTPALTPLAPHAKKLLMVSGLELRHMLDTGHNNGHQATPFLLTGKRGAPFEGTWDGVKNTAGGPSIDQHIAQRLPGKGIVTKFPSLVLRTGYYKGNDGYSSISGPPISGKVNAPLPEHDPVKLFAKVFGDLIPGSGTAGDALRRRAMGKSILDHVNRSARRLGEQLGTADRLKIDAHLQGIREVERQLAAAEAPPAAGCVPPAPVTTADYLLGDQAVRPKLIPLLTDLTLAAFRCDLTRIATIGWGAPAFAFPTPGEIRPDDRSGTGGPYLDEHGIAHAQYESTDTKLRRTLVDRWFAAQFSDVLRKMDAIPEGDGTMLDHSVVLFANQMGDGAHHTIGDLPWVLAGSGNGYFKTGRALRWPSGEKNKRLPQIRLLRTLASAFDIPSDGFADPAYGDDLPGVRA